MARLCTDMWASRPLPRHGEPHRQKAHIPGFYEWGEGADRGVLPGGSRVVCMAGPLEEEAAVEQGAGYLTIVKCSAKYESQAISAAAGMVNTHAHTMLVAMPQRTAFRR